ncbi:MAG: hypothetical protein HUU16_22635, partial [Candidatus Omnitrophica bacterium]|nr:hypothetical protein [Candidatus Omnitrophota bacterium]
QPQLETFKENSLTSRSAVSVTPAGFEEPVFGTVWVAARVATDRAAGVVTCEKAFVKQVRLPGASDEQVKKLTEILKTEVPRKGLSISLDRVLAMLDLAKTEEAVKSEIAASPPRIIPVTHPAVLVCLDGEPAFSRIENSKLLRVVNTPYTIVMDPGTAKFYLRAPWGWLRASDYRGPWEKVESIPDSVAAIAPSPAGGEAKSGADPEIIVATEPTELVVIEGEPELGFVEGTDLYYLLNSKSDVFVDSSNHLYILLSGRWFTASDKRGPWSHVPSDQLPESFKAIPKTFERPHVLACISGREEAHFARLDTFVPETAAIKRKAASVTPLYVGEPEFTPIEGTALSYAANSPHDILKIDERYYCCYDGVWFESDAPKGPMAVSGSVPPAVYSLPPNCPLYHVKFVHVYDATDEIAYVGYTPGYIGCYTLGNTIVHGTGYEPQPVGSSSAIPRPHTYGFSCAYDPSAGKWGFRAPSYGGVEWFASSAGEKREVLPLSGLSFTWWGPAGYSLFGAAGSQSGQAPQLTEGSSVSSDPIYQRHPDWLARESWGRKLARRQESLPPTPT